MNTIAMQQFLEWWKDPGNCIIYKETMKQEKLTRWEKRSQAAGYTVMQFTHEEIMDHLLETFKREESELLIEAAADNTNRHELAFVLDYENIGSMLTNFGGIAHYNKKNRRFTHLSYSDRRNWAVQFSIESKVAYFAYDFWKPLQKIQRFWSIKKLSKYLLTH